MLPTKVGSLGLGNVWVYCQQRGGSLGLGSVWVDVNKKTIVLVSDVSYSHGYISKITLGQTCRIFETNLIFSLEGNDLVVKSALDYETQPKVITMSIQASDGFCDSEVYTLTVRLVDVNEPPTLLPADQTLESCEGLVSSRGRRRRVSSYSAVRWMDVNEPHPHLHSAACRPDTRVL